MRRAVAIVAILCMGMLPRALATLDAQQPASEGSPDLSLFFRAILSNPEDAEASLAEIAKLWRDGYAAMLVDLIYQTDPNGGRMLTPGGNVAATRKAPDAWVDASGTTLGANDLVFPNSAMSQRRQTAAGLSPQDSLTSQSAQVRRRLLMFLEEQTGESFAYDLGRWQRWFWSRPYDPHPDYATFKGRVFGLTDSRLQAFFPEDVPASIRLDEIEWAWGGINSIPPLEHPATLEVSDAKYLKNDHIVFGVEINGEARAYPQRILAWHEIVHDRLGGVELTLAYCTLTGAAIPYGSEAGGVLHKFGGSGLVYRSNKLMFDLESLSLWSSLRGKPVVGKLAASDDVELRPYPIVTTTWREWRKAHPDTTVLSLRTGHQRDYSEDAFLRQYASDDHPLFAVSQADDRLEPVEEVLAMRVSSEDTSGAPRVPVAISTEFLQRNRLHQAELGGQNLVVVTGPNGANRVYRAGETQFTRRVKDDVMEDATGGRWWVTESALVSESTPTHQLARVPAHRAFWFGWYAQFPETELIRLDR